ncbi:MAG: glycerol-1-phosphate dehydrogenase [NAD(P)+] [Candidatus Nanohaloarchaea archaeon]|jgi:glycerol-1-phosphate dehydrogenase [NAD(P)+]
MEIDEHKYFFFDLDKTLWNWDEDIIGAVDLIDSLREADKQVYFHTDNSLLSREAYARKLNEMNIEAEKEDILTAGYVAGEYLNQKSQTSTYVIGESGLIEELDEKDIEVKEKSDTLVVGFDRQFNYRKAEKAMKILQNGGEAVLCSSEKTFRTTKKKMPHQGMFNQAFREMGETKLIGKPSEFYQNVFQDYFSYFPDASMFIGDRLEDMETGNNLGMTTVAVMSGDMDREMLKKADEIQKPDFGLSNLSRLKRKIL